MEQEKLKSVFCKYFDDTIKVHGQDTGTSHPQASSTVILAAGNASGHAEAQQLAVDKDANDVKACNMTDRLPLNQNLVQDRPAVPRRL